MTRDHVELRRLEEEASARQAATKAVLAANERVLERTGGRVVALVPDDRMPPDADTD